MRILGFYHQAGELQQKQNKHTNKHQKISKGRLLLLHLTHAFIYKVTVSITIKKINSYSSHFRTECTHKPKERQTELKKNGNFFPLVAMNQDYIVILVEFVVFTEVYHTFIHLHVIYRSCSVPRRTCILFLDRVSFSPIAVIHY